MRGSSVFGVLLLLLGAAVSGAGENRPGAEASPPGVPVYRLPGIVPGFFAGGQDPTLRAAISKEQAREALILVAPYLAPEGIVRLYGSRRGNELAAAAAKRELGKRVALGIWLGRDRAENEAEVEAGVALARAGLADFLVVGNEVLLRGDLSEGDLVRLIRRVKVAAPPGVSVTAAEAYGELLRHPAVVAECDVVVAHFHPYWEGLDVRHGAAQVDRKYSEVVRAAGGRPVIVGETGWPSQGPTVGRAVASPENASRFFLELTSWARVQGVTYVYFEGRDEPFAMAREGPQWGVWTRDGKLKPGMERIFRGEVAADTWSGRELVGGSGAATIEMTAVPKRGSTEWVVGRVRHVRPAHHRVVLYSRVGGGWWVKPTYEEPKTLIWPDGEWGAAYATNPQDTSATALRAYLVPATFDPPLAAGWPALPEALAAKALAWIEERR